MSLSNASYHQYPAADTICRASRVPKRLHDPALLRLLGTPTNQSVISLLARKAVETIQVIDESTASTDVDMAAAEAIDGSMNASDITLPSPPITPVRPSFAQQQRQQQQQNHYQQQRRAPQVVSPCVPPLDVFLRTVVRESQVQPPTLLVTLVYLNRIKQRLPPHAKGIPDTRHRVFLATLIVAAKYLNDSTPKNSHWRSYAKFEFDLSEINLMERQLLGLLDFDLRFTEKELIDSLRPLIDSNPEMTRQLAIARVTRAGEERLAAANASTAYIPITPPHDAIPPSRRPVISHARSSYSDVGSLVEDTGTSSSEAEDRVAGHRERFVLRPVPTTAYRRRVSGNRPSAAEIVALSSSESESGWTSPTPSSRHAMDLPAVLSRRSTPRAAKTSRINLLSNGRLPPTPTAETASESDGIPTASSLPSLVSKGSGFFGKVLGLGKPPSNMAAEHHLTANGFVPRGRSTSATHSKGHRRNHAQHELA